MTVGVRDQVWYLAEEAEVMDLVPPPVEGGDGVGRHVHPHAEHGI